MYKQNLSKQDEKVVEAYKKLRSMRIRAADLKPGVPSKRSTKGRNAITRGSAAAYGSGAVRWSVGAMLGMISGDTGCRVATDREEVRLQSSERNSWTTKR